MKSRKTKHSPKWTAAAVQIDALLTTIEAHPKHLYKSFFFPEQAVTKS